MSTEDEISKMDCKKPLSLLNLPNEIIENIFGFLKFEFLTTNVSTVCTRFNEVTDEITRKELGRLRTVLKKLLGKTRDDYANERNSWMGDQVSTSLIYLIRLAARFMLLRITRSELEVMQAVCRRAHHIPGRLIDVARELIARLAADPSEEDWLLNTSGQHITTKTDGLLRINSQFTSHFYKNNKRWLGLYILDILECAVHCESRVTVLHEEEVPEDESIPNPTGECKTHGYYEVTIPELTFQPMPEHMESDSTLASEILFLFLHNAVRSSNKGLTVRECTQGMERNISQICTIRKSSLGDSTLSFLREVKRTVASSSQLLSSGRRCVATHLITRFSDIMVDKPQPTIRVEFELTCPVEQLPSGLVPEGTLRSPNDCIFTSDPIAPYKFRMTLRQRLTDDVRPVNNIPISLLVYENSSDNIIIRQFVDPIHSDMNFESLEQYNHPPTDKPTLLEDID